MAGLRVLISAALSESRLVRVRATTSGDAVSPRLSRTLVSIVLVASAIAGHHADRLLKGCAQGFFIGSRIGVRTPRRVPHRVPAALLPAPGALPAAVSTAGAARLVAANPSGPQDALVAPGGRRRGRVGGRRGRVLREQARGLRVRAAQEICAHLVRGRCKG